MGTEKVEILLIEGSPSEADLIQKMLSDAGQFEFSVQSVHCLAEGLQLLQERKFDIVLVDLLLPDSQGLDTALAVRRHAKQTAVVALTVLDDHEAALKALSMDIQDYLLICEITGPLLSRAIRYAMQRKRDSESLRESEDRFTSFMLHLSAAAWIKDPGGRYIYANTEAERIFSTPLSVLRGKTDEEVFPPETAREFRRNDERVLATGGSLQTTEVLRQPDGIEHHSIVSKFAVPDPNGQPAYVAGIAFDITELKRAQEALRESEAKFSKIFDTAPMSITISTLADGVFVDINEEGVRLSGYRRDEVVGRTALEFDIWKDPAERARMIDEIAKKGAVRDREMTFIDKQGNILCGLFSAVVIDIQGKKHLLSIVSDITERKRLEEALRKSERKFSRIFHAVPSLLGICTLEEGRFIDVNESALETLGYLREEVIGRTALELGIWEDESVRDGVLQALERQEPVQNLEIRFRGKSGQPLVGLYSGELVEIDGDRYLVSLVRDITERKKAEETIQASEAKFRTIFDSVNDAIFIRDVKSGAIVDVNRRMCEMYGMTRTEALHATFGELSSNTPPLSSGGRRTLFQKGRARPAATL